MTARNTVCLWYDCDAVDAVDAVDAANVHPETVPDSAVVAIHRAPGDYSGRQARRCPHSRDHRGRHPMPRA
jgi:predicted 3-demethylubiquinone-9 3-methyltransferase (glyoxalase superfamily)